MIRQLHEQHQLSLQGRAYAETKVGGRWIGHRFELPTDRKRPTGRSRQEDAVEIPARLNARSLGPLWM